MEVLMGVSHVSAALVTLVLGSVGSFAASQTSTTQPPDALDAATSNDHTPPDELWDSRRYWYCNAAPYRWAGHWNSRDYDAFGREYWRVHLRAERKCERFHRHCIVWCERRHQWEWDGGLPGPDENE
jgi:hypothetical protein